MSTAKPTQEQLSNSLEKAAKTHHQFETLRLEGERDEQWAGFYAAYLLGQRGDFATPSDLSSWLEQAPSADDWNQSAAAYVLTKLG